MVSSGAGTVEGLSKELQELLLVSHGRARQQLQDFSNELQPSAVLRIVTLHASILDVCAPWAVEEIPFRYSTDNLPRVRKYAYGTSEVS